MGLQFPGALLDGILSRYVGIHYELDQIRVYRE